MYTICQGARLKNHHRYIVFLSIGVLLAALIIVLGTISVVRKGGARVQTKTSDRVEVVAPLSIERIFAKDHGWVATLSAERIRTLIVTGDIIPARSVNAQVLARNDFLWPYRNTLELLRNGDITFGNLETPLLPNCPVTNEGMIFCGNVRNVEGLVFAGVDVVSLANNHAGNYGVDAVTATVEFLAKQGIIATGVGEPVVKDVRGIRFAFLGYNDITIPQPGVLDVHEETIRRDIIEAKKRADVVVVMYHWGAEYRSQPDERQLYLARFTIDAGADLVVSNHPHWIQPVELYKGKVIMYAHGNFVFDQMWSQKTREGVVGRYTFFDKNLIDVAFTPIFIEEYGQPRMLPTKEQKRILEEMQRESLEMMLQ